MTGAAPSESARTPKRSANRARRRDRRRVGREFLFRAARALVRWLPLPVASAIGHAFGSLVWTAVPWVRRQTLRNLDIAYGRELGAGERARIGRRSFALAGRGLFAWIVLHRMGPDRALARMAAEPCPEADAVLRSPQGALLLTQHSGLFELAGVYCSRYLRCSAVGRDAGNDAGTSMLIAMRTDMGVRTIEHGGAREIVRTLRDGGRVGMLADQDIRRVNGAFVPFFGKLAHTPTGPATFAVRLKVPIVVAVTEWRSFTTHAFVLPEVLRPRDDLPADEAALELTARCSAAIERAVRRRPAEWLWMHDRWRTSPEDHPDAPVWAPEARASDAGGMADAGPPAASPDVRTGTP